MNQGEIGEGTRISVRPGFLIQTGVTLATIMAGFIYMRSDLNYFIKISIENQAEIRGQQSQIISLNKEIVLLQADLKYFRDAYEKDMNRYVREPTRSR